MASSTLVGCRSIHKPTNQLVVASAQYPVEDFLPLTLYWLKFLKPGTNRQTMLHAVYEVMADTDCLSLQTEIKTVASQPLRMAVGTGVMEYNSSVDRFRDDEYPNMAQGVHDQNPRLTSYVT